MVYPLNNDTDPYHSFVFYQGVIASELVATLVLYFLLKTIHFGVWGHDEEMYEWKKNEGEEVQAPAASEWKWEQRSWNMYFAVIFGSHISCVFLPMAYLPNIYSCVVAYAHFTCFCGMLINSIFVTEKHPGRGGKTKANRVFWFLMCGFNLALIVGGLIGINDVIQ